MGRKSLANERRAQILDAFYRCISKYGLQKSTIKRIAREAGVQPSMLYHYFRNRDELIERLLDKVLDDLTTSYFSEANGSEDVETRFEKAINFLYSPEMLDKQLANFLHNCRAEVQRNPKIREILRKFNEPGLKTVGGLLMELGKTSRLSDMEAKNLTAMIFAIQDGVITQGDVYRYRTEEPFKRMSQLTKDLIHLYIEDKAKRRVRGRPS